MTSVPAAAESKGMPHGPTSTHPSAITGALIAIQQGVNQGFADAFEGGAGIPQFQQVGTEVLPY